MKTISGRSFTKQRKQLLQGNDRLYESVELPTKTSGSPLNTEIIKQTHKIMMGQDEKMSWRGNIESHLYLHAIIFLHQLAILKDIWKA